jgi:hypothetical protein
VYVRRLVEETCVSKLREVCEELFVPFSSKSKPSSSRFILVRGKTGGGAILLEGDVEEPTLWMKWVSPPFFFSDDCLDLFFHLALFDLGYS